MTFLLGRQATFGHEPPIIARSTIAVGSPCFAKVQAMIFPATPLPMIRFRTCSTLITILHKNGRAWSDRTATWLKSYGCRFLENLPEEASHGGGYFIDVRLQGEVAGVEETDLCIGEIATVRLRTGRQEERVVFAPDRQQGRPMRPKVPLKRRIECDVVLVVTEQVQLDISNSLAGQVIVVECVTIWRDTRRIGNAVRVLPARRLGSQERAQRLAVALGWVFPVRPDWIPAVAQTFLVRVA